MTGLNRIRTWLDPGERSKRRAGRQLSAFLLLLAALEPSQKAAFVRLTLKQRQLYLARLLRYLLLDSEASAVEALDWTSGEPVSGLPARRRFDKAYSIYSRASDAAMKILESKNKSKDEGIAATAVFAEAGFAIKHAWRTQNKFWKRLSAGILDELSEDEKASANPDHAALGDAARQVAFVISIAGKLERGSSKRATDKAIEAAFEEHVAWILSLGADDG